MQSNIQEYREQLSFEEENSEKLNWPYDIEYIDENGNPLK